MRNALRKLGLNKRYRFYATFSQYKVPEKKPKGFRSILFKDVMCKSKEVADHIWIKETGEFIKLNLKEGDCISFQARIVMYKRKNAKEKVDFGLKDPMYVYKINKEELDMKENNDFVIRTYSTDKYKLEVRFDKKEKTFWLTQKDLALIFSSNVKTISRWLAEVEKKEKTNPHISKMRIAKKSSWVNVYSSGYVVELFDYSESENAHNFIDWMQVIIDTEDLSSYEMVSFNQNNLSLDLRVSPDEQTIWMNQYEIAELFDTTQQNISNHINNIFEQCELEKVSVHKFFLLTGSDGKTYTVDYYNLDMILAIGYRVNSRKGIAFRKWATSVLNSYLIKGYAINEKRLVTLGKTVEIQNRMLSSALSVDYQELSAVINEYTRALDLLDDYDHQNLVKPRGHETTYQMTYEDARQAIDSMEFNLTSDLFGREKEEGKLEGILAAVHQNVFGQEVYPSLEEKAAHLLYFLVKDHPFYDGCKRIAATLFLEFLNKNGALMKNGKLVISNDALVAITLLTAESNPDEMDIIVSVIMNLLTI